MLSAVSICSHLVDESLLTIYTHPGQEPGTFNTLTGCFFLSEGPSPTPISGYSCQSGGGGEKGSPGKDTMTGDSCGGSNSANVSSSGRHASFLGRYYSMDPEERDALEQRKAKEMQGAWASAATNISSGGGNSGPGAGSIRKRRLPLLNRGQTCGGAGRSKSRFGQGTSRDESESVDMLRFSFPTRFGAVCTDGTIRVFDMEGDSFNNSFPQDDRLQDVYDADVSRDATMMFVIYKAGRFQGKTEEVS